MVAPIIDDEKNGIRVFKNNWIIADAIIPKKFLRISKFFEYQYTVFDFSIKSDKDFLELIDFMEYLSKIYKINWVDNELPYYTQIWNNEIIFRISNHDNGYSWSIIPIEYLD